MKPRSFSIVVFSLFLFGCDSLDEPTSISPNWNIEVSNSFSTMEIPLHLVSGKPILSRFLNCDVSKYTEPESKELKKMETIFKDLNIRMVADFQSPTKGTQYVFSGNSPKAYHISDVMTTEEFLKRNRLSQKVEIEETPYPNGNPFIEQSFFNGELQYLKFYHSNGNLGIHTVKNRLRAYSENAELIIDSNPKK